MIDKPARHRRILSVIGAVGMMLAASPVGAQTLTAGASSPATLSSSARRVTLAGSVPPSIRNARRLGAITGSRRFP